MHNLFPSATQTQFNLASKKSSATPKTECAVLPKGALKLAPQKLSSLNPTVWSHEAVQQFTRKRDEALKDTKATTHSFRVHFSSGACAQFLFIDSKISTYELHTELRKAFEDLVKDSTAELLLNLGQLDAGTAKRTLFAFSVLSEVAHWKPQAFGNRTRESKAKTEKKTIEFVTRLGKADTTPLLKQGSLLGQANNLVRTLADLPANELAPKQYRKHVAEFAKELGLEFEFWDCADLAKKKAGAFLAVARADLKCDAGIARLRYVPKKKKASKKKLALVGKGICFDTGGYNVKTGNYMLGMHGDMTGSAIALALCGYYAALKVDFEVEAYLALAENLISPTAYKPNEIAVACDGTAIEVVDTDAEGRMVLADTLALARREKPTLVVDFATLTGAAIRSLDTRRGAVFSNRPKLAQLAVEAGDLAGERTWSFPIGEDYRQELKSKVADILQCSSSSNADHIYAATFLSHFVGDETPWVHLDLVPAENKGGLGLVSSDTTGFGILWTAQFLELAL